MRALIVSVLVMAAAGASAFGHQSKSRIASPSAPNSPDPAVEVLAFEREMEAAVVRGDVAYLDRACTSDFSFTHAMAWTTGGQPLRVENKEQWLASVGKAPYLSRDLDSVQVESHGDIAITYGRYHARNKAGTRTQSIHRLVRAGLRAAQRSLAVRVAPHSTWADLRT
jgi:hypothetical protein